MATSGKISPFLRRMSALSGAGGITDVAAIEARLASSMGAQQASGYMAALQRMNAQALGGRARLVMTGGSSAAVPGLMMQMGQKSVALPVYDAASRLGSWGSQSYIMRGVGIVGANDQITRMSSMEWFSQGLSGIKGSSADAAFKRLSGLSGKLRSQYAFHFRNAAGGGASPLYRGDLSRITFGPEGKGGKLYSLAQEVAHQRTRSVVGISGVSLPTDVMPNGKLVAFDAMEQAHKAQTELMGLLTQQGFSGASKITVSPKGTALRAGSIPGMMYGNNLLFRPEKGPHHQAEREILQAEKLASGKLMQRTMPYMVPETASEALAVARGVANMRGIAPTSRIMLDAPIRLAGLAPKAGLGPEQLGRVEAMLQTILGDSGVLGAGRHAQSIVNQGFGYNIREVKLAGYGGGGSSEWAVHPLLEQYAGKPGIYNTSITAEQIVQANKSRLTGLTKAQSAEVANSLGTVAQSMTTTGSYGPAIKLRTGETINRVLADEGGMRLIIGTKRRGGAGARMIIGGETRMTMVENIGRVKMGGMNPHFIAKLEAGGIPYRPMMLPNMAAQLSWAQVNGKSIGREAVDIMSSALGGHTQELAPGQFSVGFGRGAMGADITDAVQKIRSGLESKFGTTGYSIGDRAVGSIDELLAPQMGSIPQEMAERLALRAPEGQRAEVARMLTEDVSSYHFTTTAAMRANQPGRGGPLHYRMQKLNLLASQMGMGEQLFGPMESTAGMSGMAAEAAHTRNMGRSFWGEFTAARNPRNKAIRGLMSDFTHLGRGDDALLEHLKATGRTGDIWSLDKFQKHMTMPQKVTGRIRPSQAGGYLWKKNMMGRMVPTSRSIILDLGGVYPQAMGADQGLNRRYAILPAGLTVSARTDQELFTGSGKNSTRAMRLGEAQLQLAHAATAGLPPEEIAAAAGRVNARISEQLLNKKGWVNRQVMSGWAGTQMAMVSDATMMPGDVGITGRFAKRMGMSPTMIARARKHGVYGMTGTDPAFSGVHTQFNRIRVVDKPGSDMYSVFLHNSEAAARYRDFDADVMSIFVPQNRNQNQALKAMFEYTNAASKAGLARQTHQAIMEAAGRQSTGIDIPRWSQNVFGPDTAAEIKGAIAKDLTGTGTRVPYSLLRKHREVTMGVLTAMEQGPNSALWESMGLNESVLSKQHVQKAMERMVAAKKAMGADGLNNLYQAQERATYAILNAKKSGAGAKQTAQDVIKGMLDYRTVPEGQLDAHSQKIGAMIEALITAHPQFTPMVPGTGAHVANAFGAAVQLGSWSDVKARSPLASFVSAASSAQHGVGPVGPLMAQGGSMIGGVIGLGHGTGVPPGQVTTGPGAAGRMGAEQLQRAGSNHQISEIAKEMAVSGKRLVGKLLKSTAGKVGLAAAGGAALWGMLGRNSTSGPGGSGAPMPPEPMINVPTDPGLQEITSQEIRQARIERVPGVRTHASVRVHSGHRGPDLTPLGTDAFGRFGARVVQSGSFSDDMAPVEYRHQMEREIHRRMNSSF